jgi:hypothetical protein
MREQEPTDYASNDVACGEGNIYIESLEFRKACRFEKDDRVSEYGIAT